MERIRVVHIIPTLDQSGAEKQLFLLASQLPRDRFETRVLAITRGGHYEVCLKESGIQVEVIGKRLKWDPRSLSRLTGRLRELKPDIVHTWLFAGNSYGRAAAMWAKCPHVIASERCVDSWKREYQFVLDRWLARRSDAIAVNSEAVKSFYTKVGIPAEKIVVVANAIEPRSEVNVDCAVADLRIELDLPADVPTIGFVGRLWPQKRVQDLIWAADILRIGGWNFHLLIVGDGPRRAALERLTRTLDLKRMVHFLGHRSDARTLIDLMDVAVIPSKFEGMPNVALEAMQAGKPVVATRIPGMDEVVQDGVTGSLVPPKRPMELARAISKLLNEPDRRNDMGRLGRQRVAQLFSVERMVQGYAELYAKVVANAPS